MGFRPPDSRWTVGDDGIILHFDGETWQRVPAPTSEIIAAVSMLSPSDGWAAGNAGTILHWDGSTWSATVTGDCPTAATACRSAAFPARRGSLRSSMLGKRSVATAPSMRLEAAGPTSTLRRVNKPFYLSVLLFLILAGCMTAPTSSSAPISRMDLLIPLYCCIVVREITFI